MGKEQFIDLSGQTIGKWSVIKRVKKKDSPVVFFQCQCECGTRRVVDSDSLKRGISKSCGTCGSHTKIVCKRGHDTSVLGRTEAGACRACVREDRLLKQYGITLLEYTELWNFQEGKCAICEAPLQAPTEIGKPGWNNGIRVEVDHNHDKSLTPRQAVRGLLCGGRWKGCNRRLGHIDDAHWLRKASEYLENPPAQSFIKSKEKELDESAEAAAKT